MFFLWFLLIGAVINMALLAIPAQTAYKNYLKDGITVIHTKNELSQYDGKWVEIAYEYVLDTQYGICDYFFTNRNYGIIKLCERAEYLYVSTESMFWTTMRGKNCFLNMDEVEGIDNSKTYTVVGYVSSIEEDDLNMVKGQTFWPYDGRRRLPNDEHNTNYDVAIRISTPGHMRRMRNIYSGWAIGLFMVWCLLSAWEIKRIISMRRK